MSVVNSFPLRTHAVSTLLPVSNTGAALNTTVIDRKGYQSAKLILNIAASTGAPTSCAAALDFYSNSASSTSSPTPVKLVALETALDVKAGGTFEYDIDLSNAKRYIFASIDTTYVAGTTPANIIGMTIVLGDKNVQPANSGSVYGR